MRTRKSRLLFLILAVLISGTFEASQATGKFPPVVTSEWSNSHHLDLFRTDASGEVVSTWWDTGCGWQPWFAIHPEVKMQPQAPVTAVWRSNHTHLDLFVTGNDGAVWSTWWEGPRGWQPWFLIHSEVKMQPGATVTALWRSNDTHLDLFSTGNDGAVWSTWWEGSPGWQKWFLIHPEVKMQPGATVTAMWRSNNTHLDLFSTGNDGAVWSTWWEGAPGWQKWFLIHPEVKMQPGATVSAVWRSNDTHLDLFSTGTDMTVWSTWWEATPNWQKWFSIYSQEAMQRVTDTSNVLTNLHDNRRTGVYQSETTLTPANVTPNSFGMLYQRQVQGQMLAQPLYLRGVKTRTQGAKNLIIVATAANMVYAFDADNSTNTPTAGLVFSRKLHNSNPLDPSLHNSKAQICTETYPPYIGVTSTPVIDAAHNTMYVVSFNSDDGNDYLHALDLTDGLKDKEPPVIIQPPDSMISAGERSQNYVFGLHQRNRPGLLMQNGVIYIAFATFICDGPSPYAGWVFGYSKELQQLSAWRTPKDVDGGGIWQSGRGLVGGPDDSIYFMTGNDLEFNGDSYKRGTLGNSFVKLGASCGADVKEEGAFEPANSIILSNGDTDLGSSGPILVHDRLIGGGKQGRVYVLNAKTMALAQNATSADGFEGFQGFLNTYHGPGQVKMRPGATVTAVWRSNQTHLDLFVTGTDGAVWSTWWEATPGWQTWFLIHPEVKMQPGVTVSAVWRSNDTHVDLFATGTDGAVWSTWWEAGPGWQNWFLIHPEVKMQPGATVNALWRSNQTHLDLFATGTDGAVWSTWWEAAPGWQKWFTVHPEVKMQPGATVNALWRSNQTHLDLFATGTDGAVWSTWWESAPGWQKWFLIHPEVKMQPGATVSAQWRSNDTHLDLFATGNDGAVWSSWWEGTPGWQKWFLIHPDIQACTNLTINAEGITRVTPDQGNPDKYCRDPNTVQNGKPGYNWPEVGQYQAGCYLPISCYQICQTYGPNIHAGLVYWELSPDHGYIYGMPEKDYLRQFEFHVPTQHVDETPVHVSQYRTPDGMPGAAISVSANGERNGIVWVSMPSIDEATGGIHRGTLLAADALDLHELWRDDCVQYFAKFNPPIIADGKVVLATFADPSGQAVPGQGCNAGTPPVDTNVQHYGTGPGQLNAGTAWVIVYGPKP